MLRNGLFMDTYKRRVIDRFVNSLSEEFGITRLEAVKRLREDAMAHNDMAMAKDLDEYIVEIEKKLH